jgi:RNase H-fold protein (predicted Holliday junction resolvase)
MYFSLSEIIFKHNVDTIVIGMPARQKDIQAKIQAFIKSLETIIDKEKVSIQTVDEDYTSVQA